ncbi:MAG TPA: hypothetical protein VJC18_02295 [bacterium]|nr:hypothetical protein [bacterium]
MTLIEVMLSLAIIAGIMAFVVGAAGNSSGNELRRLAGQMVRTIKHAYMQAAIANGYYRLAIDLSAQPQTYQLEYSAKPFYIVNADDEKEELRKKNEERLVGEEEQSLAKAVGVGEFSEAEDDLVPRTEISADIKIMDVRTEHDQDAVAEGITHLYFFPKGYTEFSIIHLSDAEETKFITLIVNPLTGEVDVVEDFVEHEDALQRLGLSEEE